MIIEWKRDGKLTNKQTQKERKKETKKETTHWSGGCIFPPPGQPHSLPLPYLSWILLGQARKGCCCCSGCEHKRLCSPMGRGFGFRSNAVSRNSVIQSSNKQVTSNGSTPCNQVWRAKLKATPQKNI